MLKSTKKLLGEGEEVEGGERGGGRGGGCLYKRFHASLCNIYLVSLSVSAPSLPLVYTSYSSKGDD